MSFKVLLPVLRLRQASLTAFLACRVNLRFQHLRERSHYYKISPNISCSFSSEMRKLGSVDFSPQPDQGAGKTEETPVISGLLVKPRKNPAILLELAK
ncbi:MAG: hypothetical protein KME13_07940, partial [Myxacorys californica WJT36-NPBG1]|nr:hypothetical protein [Myxacorys californica WJT36-NPBG1]